MHIVELECAKIHIIMVIFSPLNNHQLWISAGNPSLYQCWCQSLQYLGQEFSVLTRSLLSPWQGEQSAKPHKHPRYLQIPSNTLEETLKLSNAFENESVAYLWHLIVRYAPTALRMCSASCRMKGCCLIQPHWAVDLAVDRTSVYLSRTSNTVTMMGFNVMISKRSKSKVKLYTEWNAMW